MSSTDSAYAGPRGIAPRYAAMPLGIAALQTMAFGPLEQAMHCVRGRRAQGISAGEVRAAFAASVASLEEELRLPDDGNHAAKRETLECHRYAARRTTRVLNRLETLGYVSKGDGVRPSGSAAPVK